MQTDVSRDLPRPPVALDQAARILRERYGHLVSPDEDLDLRELGSQQDRNFLLATAGRRYLLKVANPAFTRAELEAQLGALGALAAGGIRVQEPVPGADGAVLQEVRVGGAALTAYLLSFLAGAPLAGHAYLAPVVVARMGELSGGVVRALQGFAHPGTKRAIQWDLCHGGAVVRDMELHVDDVSARERVSALAAFAVARLEPLTPYLRTTVIHGDVTDDNVVCATTPDGRPWPAGVIDLGDLHRGWLVAELAVTCASLLQHSVERPFAVLPAVRAFADVVPLEPAEVSALWPLISLRAAVLAVSGYQQLAVDPGNDYVSEQRDREDRLLRAAASVPFELAEEAIRDALGMPSDHRGQWPPPARDVHPMVPDLLGARAATAAPLDLSVTSDDLHEGRWLHPGIESRLAAAAQARDGSAVLRWGEYRLTRSGVDQRLPPAAFALSAELYLPDGTPVHAPLPGGVTWPESAGDGRLTLAADGFDLLVSGLDLQSVGPEAGQPVGADAPRPAAVAVGDVLGSARRGRPVAVQVCLARGSAGWTTRGAAPAFATADDAAAWARLCPDPSPLLGLDCAAPAPDPADLLARRGGAFADVQEHYYPAPPQVERGWRHHLIDTTARTYLDMLNNVTSIGHGHPRLVRDLARQWGLLNTNSRFHYSLLPELSERLAAKAPDGLDTVLLVNSGSEAVDLALRIARAHTRRRAVLAVEEGYHGWTFGADAVTSSIADNPNALGTRPDWVHLVSAPNSYRGVHRGPDTGTAYVHDVEQVLAAMAKAGIEPAAFIAEPFYGNAGGIALPPGYLQGVYAAVRAAGGLCIADEVQVGYGRLGRWFWGVQEQGVVPDVITVAKAMGNGHPLGAVITRREIAESLATEGSFFSSAGGSPVSCRAGLTVLDVLEEEDLQGNAHRVGSHLKRRLEQLATRHPLVGAVHGAGLYLGVELVRDHATLEPATQETSAICDRLLELGVVVQPTGDRRNVLKIKPPLCITRESADFFADRLDEVLTDGW